MLSAAAHKKSCTSLRPAAAFNSSAAISRWLMYTRSTSIRFWVRVPVLSEQMTETQPRLSTAFRSFMTACSAAIFWVPMACTMVTMELSASGMAATARATANMRASSTGSLRYRLMANTNAQTAVIPNARWPENRSRLIWSGVFFSPVSLSREAILPISVAIPVAVTTATARPEVTSEPEKIMLIRSPTAIG